MVWHGDFHSAQVFSEICFCGVKLTTLTISFKHLKNLEHWLRDALLQISPPPSSVDKYIGDLFHCSLQASVMA